MLSAKKKREGPETKRLKAKTRSFALEFLEFLQRYRLLLPRSSPRFFDVQLHKWRLVPAAGGITCSSFSFSPVTLVATLFIDVTVPGHDIPGGRNESSVQSGDVGRLPSSFILLRFRVIPFAKDFLFSRLLFFIAVFSPLSRNQRFLTCLCIRMV